MEGLAQLLNTVELLKDSLNPSLKNEGILLTMYDGRNNLSKLVAEEIQKTFPEQTFKTIIPRNVKLSECPSHGKPIILYDITSKGSEAYLNLAKEIIVKERRESDEVLQNSSLVDQVINRDNQANIPSFNEYQV